MNWKTREELKNWLAKHNGWVFLGMAIALLLWDINETLKAQAPKK